MSKIWEPQDFNTYKYWVTSILTEASDELSDWEASFVDSISERLEQNRNLTEAQAEKLESIYAAKTK